MSAASGVASEALAVRVELPTGEVRQGSFPAGQEVWLGRDPTCQFVLDARNVSRKHLCARLEERVILIRDRSANGTWIAGQRVHRGSVRLDQARLEIRVGPFRVTLGRNSSESRPAPRSDASLRRRIHARLLDHLELDKVRPGVLPDAALRSRVQAALREIVQDLTSELDPLEDVDALVSDLADEALGLGPLEGLLSDPSVSEILVVDPRTIFAERDGRLEATDLAFTDDEAVRSAIERIVTPLGRRIDESAPLVDARLPDGSRVNAIIPPLATRGPCITIRKFPARALTLDDLVRGGSLSERMARFLTRCVRAKKNIVVSGGTGSGKTTLLNVLSAAVPASERIVTIEDAAELRLAQPHVVTLEARPPNLEGKGEYTIRDLVKNALRMRPDRIVVGECRGGEALDMLQAMNTGHEGSMTTTHANSPREALSRLELLCLMAGVDLPLAALRRQIAASIHLIVQQTRDSEGKRRVTNITEVTDIDDDGQITCAEIFVFERTGIAPEGDAGGEFRATGRIPSFMGELVRLAGDDGEALL